jgi:hypothetical protein
MTEQAAHRAQLTAQGELAEHQQVLEARGCGLGRRGDQRERDRQVERGAALLDVGGREVEHHMPAGQRQAAALERALHAHAALAHGRVAQAHDVDPRQALPEERLDLDRDRVDAVQGGGVDGRVHAVGHVHATIITQGSQFRWLVRAVSSEASTDVSERHTQA